MGEKHYVGEINTEIRVDCGRDVSTASVRKLFLRKPDGTVVELVPSVYNKRYLRYFTTESTFDMPGEYQLQSYIELSDWKGRGETAFFVIFENYA